jgi:hypothetical protein
MTLIKSKNETCTPREDPYWTGQAPVEPSLNRTVFGGEFRQGEWLVGAALLSLLPFTVSRVV